MGLKGMSLLSSSALLCGPAPLLVVTSFKGFASQREKQRNREREAQKERSKRDTERKKERETDKQ